MVCLYFFTAKALISERSSVYFLKKYSSEKLTSKFQVESSRVRVMCPEQTEPLTFLIQGPKRVCILKWELFYSTVKFLCTKNTVCSLFPSHIDESGPTRLPCPHDTFSRKSKRESWKLCASRSAILVNFIIEYVATWTTPSDFLVLVEEHFHRFKFRSSLRFVILLF